ncbi:hypothetical protein GC102_25140 [Paenibacillus sp. LMG 31460]|uniref:Uncharacterized protein n=1 Tax=Paenibacillus germinis TaxID=2654979 RepID=A0ABX1Z6K0_9BACL|nr:hypothetical protein [Paenibacillus germinis]NOU89008.1 hypothetical protein [Paenibacillus germinis]
MSKTIRRLIVAGVLCIGGYGIYQYSLNVIGDKIANQLAAEAASNPQWLDQFNLAPLPQTTNDAAASSDSDKPETTEEDLKVVDPKLASGEAMATVPTKEEAGNTQPTVEPSNEKKTAENKGLAFESKQEAVKFVMGRFSVSEINHIRQMASGELTSEKKAELKRIAYSRFSASEIEAVRKVVSK